MTLYEINSKVMEILTLMEPDPETGLMPDNCEELAKKLDELGLQRQQKLEGVARYVLNVRSDISALKAEEARLASRRKVLENKEKSLMSYLDHACNGQKTDFGVATLCYRKSEKVMVSDEDAARRFLAENHYSNCLRYIPAEISKTDLKALIKTGVEVPGASLQTGTSCSLR